MRQVLHDPLLVEGGNGGMKLEIAMQWNDSYNETIHSFANSINTIEGGTHLAGFKVPEFVEFTDEPLPRNAAGKLLKNVLRGTGAVPFDTKSLG